MNEVRLWFLRKKNRLVRTYKFYDWQCSRPFRYLKRQIDAKRSERLEKRWTENRFLLGEPTQSRTQRNSMPINLLDEISPGHRDFCGPKLSDLQAELHNAVANLHGTPPDYKSRQSDT